VANFNTADEMKKQYGTAANLDSRVLLHQLFSTNKLGWSKWVFQNYHLEPNQTILELGCGNATIWRENADKIPTGTKLVLSDFSSGMLAVAQKTTSGLNFVDEYAVIDAQSIPFRDDTFDIVIANHMLYHVPNISMALIEISRVLKPDGVFYATTIGKDNMREIVDMLHAFDPGIDFALDAILNAFGLESGEALLAQVFDSVDSKRYDDSLHVTEPKPLVDYILSSQGMGNVGEIIVGDKVKAFHKYIEGLFAKDGYINIQKDAGIFIASVPIKHSIGETTC